MGYTGSRSSLLIPKNDPPVIFGRHEIRVDEQDESDPTSYTGAPDMPLRTVPGTVPGDATNNTYTASDEDARDQATWSIEGEDAALFVLSAANLSGLHEPRDLKFIDPPDFENPGDADGDSVYKVTVVATDESDASDKMDVTVFVENVQEDGELNLSSAGANSAQPTIGEVVTAEVADPDNDVTLVTWQWSTAATIDAATSTPIMGATESTYTPVDGDEGLYLRAHAVYTDTHSEKDDLATPEIDERVQWLPKDENGEVITGQVVQAKEPNATSTDIDGNMIDIPCCQYRVTETSQFAVREDEDTGGGGGGGGGSFAFGGTGATFTRLVAENARIGTRVGDPVTATSAVEYILSSSTGDDASFEIDEIRSDHREECPPECE